MVSDKERWREIIRLVDPVLWDGGEDNKKEENDILL